MVVALDFLKTQVLLCSGYCFFCFCCCFYCSHCCCFSYSCSCFSPFLHQTEGKKHSALKIVLFSELGSKAESEEDQLGLIVQVGEGE